MSKQDSAPWSFDKLKYEIRQGTNNPVLNPIPGPNGCGLRISGFTKFGLWNDKKGLGFDNTDVAPFLVVSDDGRSYHLTDSIMGCSSERAESRRDFFRAIGRYGLLGCLAAVGAVTGRRAQLSGQRCINQGLCGKCAVFASCGLPQAISAKQVRAGGLR